MLSDKMYAVTERMRALCSRISSYRLPVRGERQEEQNVRFAPHEEHLARALGRFEPFIIKVQKILLWESPMISCMCVIVVNIVFWLAISFQCRFYGVIFTTILFGFVCNMWMQKIWPRISIPTSGMNEREDSTAQNPRVLSMPEISHYLGYIFSVLKDYYIRLKTLRDTQPGLFCCGMCLCFSVLTLIGRTVPGLVISYCLIMIIMIGPGIWIHLLHPPSMIQHVWNFHAVLHPSQDTDSEVEDYLPEQTGENLALLQLAGDANEEEQNDESLIIAEEFGLESADINTVLAQEEGSTDGLDISEFDLSAPPSVHSTNNHESNYNERTRLDPDSSDTDDDGNVGSEEQIRFQSLHFNRDSSEEEELAFAHGLAFTENSSVPTQTVPTATTAGLTEMLTSTAVQAVSKNIANLGAMGQSLLSTVLSGGSHLTIQEPNRDESSSGESEDFEMISQEDLS
ncbi:reticulophagy regulator 3 [Anabrus simplex]|uniref:reticulophagy regulator 3 n=1 Tax=Anabrus simplex TaxID=316456 RepID=UPI0035A2EEB6